MARTQTENTESTQSTQKVEVPCCLIAAHDEAKEMMAAAVAVACEGRSVARAARGVVAARWRPLGVTWCCN